MLIPLFDKILVEPIEEKTTRGGIVLPNGADATAEVCVGKVVSVGEGYILAEGGTRPCVTKVGDIVHYIRRFALELKDGERKLHLIKDNDPICKEVE